MTKLFEQVEVHLNFSPIIYADNWLAEYEELFEKIKRTGIPFKSECIFLTYSQVQANRNSTEVNALCYNEDLQETKTSEHGGENFRYKHQLKGRMIENFKDLYGKYFDLSTIRYIF
jgi:DNA repair photolyase